MLSSLYTCLDRGGRWVVSCLDSLDLSHMEKSLGMRLGGEWVYMHGIQKQSHMF